MVFKLTRCDPSITGSDCATESEITEFIKGYSVKTWVIEQEMDYEIYDERPVFFSSKEMG